MYSVYIVEGFEYLYVGTYDEMEALRVALRVHGLVIEEEV